MDIRDIKAPAPELKPGDNIFFKVWKLQAELVEDYVKIESLPKPPLSNLHTKSSQNLIKDFISRVVEEVAEAYEAMIKGDPELWWEELADALHFLIEIFIYVYESPKEAVSKVEHNDLLRVLDTTLEPENNNQAAYWNVVYRLNLARNFLRNKDWKQTQVIPKVVEFERELHRGLYALNWLFKEAGFSPEDVWEYYWKKNQVNRFRIRSKY